MKDAILQHKETLISPELKISRIDASSRTQEKGSMREHKHNAKASDYDTRNKIQHDVCPRYGGMLVERHSKYSFFLGGGRLNYPKCTFTLDK